jgi:hypothetical protein
MQATHIITEYAVILCRRSFISLSNCVNESDVNLEGSRPGGFCRHCWSSAKARMRRHVGPHANLSRTPS